MPWRVKVPWNQSAVITLMAADRLYSIPLLLLIEFGERRQRKTSRGIQA